MIKYIEMLKGIEGAFQKSKFFSPLSLDEINTYEKENNLYIPQSYKEWLKLTNGCELFGRYVVLYGINNPPKPQVGDNFSNGLIPKEYLVLGSMNSQDICYSKEKDTFFFFDYEEPKIFFSNFTEILEYIIDICTN